jgi:hypothetical protein
MNKKYRVFDRKGSLVQTYDSALSGSLNWAKDCARHSGGVVIEYTAEQILNKEEGTVICDFRVEKTTSQ